MLVVMVIVKPIIEFVPEPPAKSIIPDPEPPSEVVSAKLGKISSIGELTIKFNETMQTSNLEVTIVNTTE